MTGIKRADMVVRQFPGTLVPGKKIIIMSVSGGKDSLAMWLMLYRTGTPNLIPVNFDGGWEWACAKVAIGKVEKITGLKCVYLGGPGLFDEGLKEKGWPRWNLRWCSGIKRDMMNLYVSSLRRGHPNYEVVTAIGVAYDERSRRKKPGMKLDTIILPLVELKITERRALKICARAGIDWGGYYMRHNRLSCWCCPWCRLDDWREMYSEEPELWAKMKEMDKNAPRGRKFYWSRKNLRQMGKIFDVEQKQGII